MARLAWANSTGERNRLLANDGASVTRSVAQAMAARLTHRCGNTLRSQ